MSKQIFTWCKSITQATSRLGFGLQLVTVVLPDWKQMVVNSGKHFRMIFSLGQSCPTYFPGCLWWEHHSPENCSLSHCKDFSLKSNDQLLDTNLWFHQCVEWHNALCAPIGASLQWSQSKQFELFIFLIDQASNFVNLVRRDWKISNSSGIWWPFTN